MQARQLRLPPAPPPTRTLIRPAGTPATTSSFLFEPSSGSLALTFTDSSVILYPSISSPFAASPPPPSPPPTVIPPVSTASCFLRLVPSPLSREDRILFLTAAPRGPNVALRAWALQHEGFVRERLSLGKRAPGVEMFLDLKHGFKVSMSGSVNLFVVYSVAAGKILVLGARVAGENEEHVEVMKCTVIDCVVPVYAISVSSGLLMLGEVGGVRVFPVRPLMKGKRQENREEALRMGVLEKSRGGSSSRSTMRGEAVKVIQKKRLPNGVIPVMAETADAHVVASPANHIVQVPREAASEVEQVGIYPAGDCKHAMKEHIPIKHKTLKLKQTSGAHGSFFLELKRLEDECPDANCRSVSSLKVMAIHAFARRKFLILDSLGSLHILFLRAYISSEVTSTDAIMKHVDCLLKVQKLAILPDLSSAHPESQIAWISDGLHSLHVVLISGLDDSIDANADKDKATELHVSVNDVIFTSERIQDIAPFAANSVLTLAKGNMYAYATD